MSEVDEIEARLRGPVNCWLTNAQQIDFARLVQLGRRGEMLLGAAEGQQKLAEALGPANAAEAALFHHQV
jgi:hypothetical protein